MPYTQSDYAGLVMEREKSRERSAEDFQKKL